MAQESTNAKATRISPQLHWGGEGRGERGGLAGRTLFGWGAWLSLSIVLQRVIGRLSLWLLGRRLVRLLFLRLFLHLQKRGAWLLPLRAQGGAGGLPGGDSGGGCFSIGLWVGCWRIPPFRGSRAADGGDD